MPSSDDPAKAIQDMLMDDAEKRPRRLKKILDDVKKWEDYKATGGDPDDVVNRLMKLYDKHSEQCSEVTEDPNKFSEDGTDQEGS